MAERENFIWIRNKINLFKYKILKSNQKWHKNKHKEKYLKNLILQKLVKQKKIINLNAVIIHVYFQ